MRASQYILGLLRASFVLLPLIVFGAEYAHGQTVQLRTLSVAGARVVLHVAENEAEELSAPSSLAVVDAAGDLILFEQMQGARPIGITLAIAKARSAARYQEPTQTLEATINKGRAAAITADMVQMEGGIPIRVDGAVVGAVGVSGLDKSDDIKIATAAATTLK